MEHSRNLIQCPSMLQMSCQVSALSRTLSHLVQLPCLFMATALTRRISSSALQTSAPCHGLAMIQLALVEQPRPHLPWATHPTMSAWCRQSSASLSALLAEHLWPVLTSMSAWRTLASWLSRSVMACCVFVALYSSTTDVTGSCSLLPLLYRPMEQKLLRTPSHLLR